ncbi:MAG TPA: hypothetical protein PK603_00350, partial [Bacteroidales bacterium]|nr:hypothetical protein [Bacteroidales bacterium]
MMKEMYANILFPLALDSEFTYRIPPELTPAAVPGKQVTAPVGNHIQTGIITHIFDVPHTLDVPPTLDVPHTLDVPPTLDAPHTLDVPPTLDAPHTLNATPTLDAAPTLDATPT